MIRDPERQREYEHVPRGSRTYMVSKMAMDPVRGDTVLKAIFGAMMYADIMTNLIVQRFQS